MKVLVTGGYGNLGSWLVRHLAGQGHDVHVLSRSKKTFLDHVPHTFVQCDITSTADCQQLAANHYDAVVHAASQNDFFIDDYPRKALMANTLGTRNLLEAFKEQPPAQFLYFSTFHVYGAAHGTITETSPTVPRNDYASTHLFAEYYVKQFHATHKLPFDIIRLTNSYGCPIDPNTGKWYLVLNDLAKMAVEKQQIVLNSNGKAQRDFIWMGDVANVIGQLLARDAPSNTIYNLGSEQTFQVLEIAEAVQRAYIDRFGSALPIRVNEADTNPHDKVLAVQSSKINQVVTLAPANRFYEEALAIFDLLEKQA